MLLVNELHLIQYYYKTMNTRIYNTVNVHKRMLHKCVNTEVIVGSLWNFNTLYMTRSCGSTNHDKHLKYLKIDININQL